MAFIGVKHEFHTELTGMSNVFSNGAFDNIPALLMKNLCQIEHTRHRSPRNFIVNLLVGIVAYCLAPSKPELDVTYSNP